MCLSDLSHEFGIRVEAQIRPHETSVNHTANYRPTARFCDLRSADCYARE
jgi:hypothetical protein